jgi:hypothetical protein
MVHVFGGQLSLPQLHCWAPPHPMMLRQEGLGLSPYVQLKPNAGQFEPNVGSVAGHRAAAPTAPSPLPPSCPPAPSLALAPPSLFASLSLVVPSSLIAPASLGVPLPSTPGVGPECAVVPAAFPEHATSPTRITATHRLIVLAKSISCACSTARFSARPVVP